MRPITLLLIVVALIFSGLAAFFAKKVVSNKPTVVVGADGEMVKAEPMTKVLVAKTNMPAGHVIAKKDLEWRRWPKKSVTPTLVVGGEKFKIDEFVGATVVHGFIMGEPVTAGRVFTQGSSSFMSGYITPGMRAMGVPVTAKMGMTGHIQPGDRVDIILVYKFGGDSLSGLQEGALKKNNIRIYSSETIIKDVRVLAVGSEVADLSGKEIKKGKKKKKKKKKKSKKLPKHLTLEVSPKQSEIIAMASTMGKLVFVVRSLSNGSEKYERERRSYTGDVEFSRSLQAVHNLWIDEKNAGGMAQGGIPLSATTGDSSTIKAPSSTVNIYRGNRDAETMQIAPSKSGQQGTIPISGLPAGANPTGANLAGGGSPFDGVALPVPKVEWRVVDREEYTKDMSSDAEYDLDAPLGEYSE